MAPLCILIVLGIVKLVPLSLMVEPDKTVAVLVPKPALFATDNIPALILVVPE